MKEANLLRHGRVEREDLAEGFDELKRRVRQAEVGPGQDREDAGVVIASKLSEKNQAVIRGSVCSAAVDKSRGSNPSGAGLFLFFIYLFFSTFPS